MTLTQIKAMRAKLEEIGMTILSLAGLFDMLKELLEKPEQETDRQKSKMANLVTQIFDELDALDEKIDLLEIQESLKGDGR